MMGFLLGAATGYVLGARAGRERYEQIVRTYRSIADSPAVQNAAGAAREKVTGVVTSRIKPLRAGRNGRVDKTATTPSTPVTTMTAVPATPPD